MKQKISLYALALLLIVALAGFTNSGEKPADETAKKKSAIRWISIEEAAKLNEKEPRKIFIDVYTDWCGWCKKMDRDTFSDADIANYVNMNYYAVKFNAESKDPVTLNGRTFNFRPEYKAHELAAELLQGKMGYPTTVYLDEKFNLLSPQPGYLTVPQLDKILHYYGDNHYKTQSYPDFEKSYSPKK